MNFPTLEQVRGRASRDRSTPFFHNFSLSKAEILKAEDLLKNNKSMMVIDEITSFNHFLNRLDSIFGNFRNIKENKVTFRGKLEYKSTIIDSETKEKQAILTLSDPKSLYRNTNNKPIFLRVPYKDSLSIGSYVEVDIHRNNKNSKYMYFTEPENIRPLNIEFQIPTLYLDYSKFNDVFKLDYGFDLSSTGQKYRRNMELSNIDLMLLNKVAGENFHNEVKGGVNCNLIKTSHDLDTYNLEVLDTFFDKVTFSQQSGSVFNANLISTGQLKHFNSILNKNNRELSTTPYQNFFGCNIGFSLGRTLNAEKDKFIERLPNTNIDYVNPITNITTRTNSAVKRLLNIDKEYVFSSKALFLETQLLPIKAKLGHIIKVEPRVLRMATMLNKFENCIDDLGTDEILPKLNLKENSIEDSRIFLKRNIKDLHDFL